MAVDYCLNGKVLVNQLVETNPRRTIGYHEQIQINGEVVRQGTNLKYVLFYKPNLYECTSNRQIENHIYEILPPSYQDLFALGRLDKNSEGLLLLTNDGQMYREMMNHESSIEKEYLVQTFHPITPALAESFINPFQLGQRHTLPAKFEKVDDFSFKVILKEGINRHIRRICAKNHNQVQKLTRIRFGNHWLGELTPGTYLEINSF
jgi:23S rRNA pseudouridine2604 synthase